MIFNDFSSLSPMIAELSISKQPEPLKAMRNEPLSFNEYVAGISCELLDVEEILLQQRGLKEMPFPGMDKGGRGVCLRNEKGMCYFGSLCPLRHVVGDKAVVCKHWLRGLCKKGDQCEFLHEYDLSKMPECFFFSKYSACSNRECPFRHIDPESKIKDCPWYDRGFCRHGPFCKNRHRRRVLCPNYIVGFCPDGPLCKYAHPSFNIPSPDTSNTLRNRGHFNIGIICHNCHERGHKATYCPHLPSQTLQQHQNQEGDNHRLHSIESEANSSNNKHFQKALSEVTCYKCGEKGHYANRCHKGVLAFLSTTVHIAQEQREKDEKDSRFSQSLYGGFGNRAQPVSITQVSSSAAKVKCGEMIR